MAQPIENAKGKDALIATITQGPGLFLSAYNSLAQLYMKIIIDTQ